MTISKLAFYTCVISYLLSGSSLIIINSLQKTVTSLNVLFRHPWFIPIALFIGEFCCFFIYYIIEFIKIRNRRKLLLAHREHEELISVYSSKSNYYNKVSIFAFILPAMCDVLGVILNAFALLNLETSIFQMLSGGSVLCTALLARIFLKQKVYRHHLLGLFIIFLSFILVGFAGLNNNDESSIRETSFVGVVIIFFNK